MNESFFKITLSFWIEHDLIPKSFSKSRIFLNFCFVLTSQILITFKKILCLIMGVHCIGNVSVFHYPQPNPCLKKPQKTWICTKRCKHVIQMEFDHSMKYNLEHETSKSLHNDYFLYHKCKLKTSFITRFRSYHLALLRNMPIHMHQ